MALDKTTTSQTEPHDAASLEAASLDILALGPSTQNARMQNRNGQYQRAQIESASPARLIVLLYDGAIRFCTQALEAMTRRQIEAQNTNLVKAQRILVELMGSLKRDVGGETTDNLFRIYTYMRDQLVEANFLDRQEQVQTVLRLLYELRETWIEVERITRSGSEAQAQTAETITATAVTGIKPQLSIARSLRLGDRSA